MIQEAFPKFLKSLKGAVRKFLLGALPPHPFLLKHPRLFGLRTPLTCVAIGSYCLARGTITSVGVFFVLFIKCPYLSSFIAL